MREEESNWFSKWEEELPSPDELMPLSQSLITPDLALAFDIGGPPGAGAGSATPISLLRHPNHLPHPYSSELDSSSADIGGGSGGADQEPARTLKRPRLVWTPQLHKRFVDAVAHLGIKNAVPKTIMQLMSVDGLTRENVASHLQKYRLYLKRMQGINSGGGGAGGPGTGGDSATDRLFASSPVPAHFLNRGGGGRPSSEQFVPYMPVALQHQQMAAAAVVEAASQGQVRQGQYHQRQMGQLGLFGQHPFLGPTSRNGMGQNSGYHAEDLESNPMNNGRKVLTLFPTGDD